MLAKKMYRCSTALATRRKNNPKTITPFSRFRKIKKLEPTEFAKLAEHNLTQLGIDVNSLRTPIDVFNRDIKMSPIKKRPQSAPTTIMGLVNYSYYNKKCFMSTRRCLTPI